MTMATSLPCGLLGSQQLVRYL